MEADNIGTKDYMAIVVTKEPIDYKKLNDAINTGNGDYKNKVDNALRGMLLSNVQYNSTQGRIGFSAESENKNAVASIIEIEKN